MKVNILHPWNTAISQRLQASHIDDRHSANADENFAKCMFTKLFQKHSYFLGVFFIANDTFKLKVSRVF